MPYYARPAIGFGRHWTPAVRALILANGIVHLFRMTGLGELMLPFLGLDTGRVFAGPMPWQLVTYMFLHDGLLHLLFNMFGLWIFGSELEEHLGRREFVFYYFLTGVGAGLSVWGLDAALGRQSLTVGASGAVFGLLLAYGVIWARRPITLLVFLVLPVTLEARVLVMLFAVLELLWGVSGGTGVAHFAHLGGMLLGWVYLRFLRRGLRPYLHGRNLLRGLGNSLRLRGEQDDRERLDQILDKVNRYGIHTLTEGERKFLDRMSRRRLQ